MLVIAAGLQAGGFAIQSTGLPFPLFAISFAASGIGISIQASTGVTAIRMIILSNSIFQDAQANGFIAIVRHEGEKKMGLLHAAYGIPSAICPS